MRRRTSWGAVSLLLLSCAHAAGAAESAPGGRRTIGLALEGGAAHGLAHIGVLEWFEAHHIPVDYIAGTSMGALIGGLYAAGKSPAELRDLTRAIDWDLVLGGTTPYRNLTFRRREDLRAYPNSFLIGLRHGVRFPPGLNAGQQITLLMDRETLAYSEIKSFDELPIPFRCVASELVTGRPKVFADGPLAEALRATMSMPGFFTPVRVGEDVYADGGIVDNLPTDVVRQMGADVVIGVHLQQREMRAGDIQSMFDVLGRSMDLAISANEARGLAGADLAVSVDVSSLSASGYAGGDSLIAKGREAAAAAEHALQPLALDEAAWTEYLRSREARQRHATPRPQFVRVEGTDARASRHLEEFLAPFVGKAIDGKRLDRDLTRLSGIGKFSRVGYRIIRDPGGREGLLVTVEENGYAPPMLQPGFEMDGTDVGSIGFTLGARLTVMDVGGYRSEWRTDVLFGSVYGIRSEYYRPWTASSKWFLAPDVEARSSSLRVDAKAGPLAEYRLRSASAGVDVGYGFSRFVQARLGYEVGYLSQRLRLGAPELGEIAGGTRAVRFGLLYDQMDDPVIPRRGAAVETSLRWYQRSLERRTAFRWGRCAWDGSNPSRARPRSSRPPRAGRRSGMGTPGCRSSRSAARRAFIRTARTSCGATSTCCSSAVTCTTCGSCRRSWERRCTRPRRWKPGECMAWPDGERTSRRESSPRRPSAPSTWGGARVTTATEGGSSSWAECSRIGRTVKLELAGTGMTYRGTVLKSRDGIPKPSVPPPGIDMAKEAWTARTRFYPVTVAYTLYALVVLPLGLRARPRTAACYIVAGVVSWTLVEYLVHRYVLHGRFPDGKGWLKHGLHRFFDTAHGDHHLRPWDGLHINGGFDSLPFAFVLALLSFLAPLPTAPVFIAAVLQSYVVEEWIHYSVHFHQFRWRYFVYIRKHHLYHHSARGGDHAFGLSSGLWDRPLGTPIPPKDREVLYRQASPRAK